MGLFDGINNAKPSQGGSYFKAGLYPRIRILRVKITTARTGDVFYAVETEIVESQVKDCPAGMKASWLCNKRHDNFLGDVRAFVAAVMGIDIVREPGRLDEVTQEVVEATLEQELGKLDAAGRPVINPQTNRQVLEVIPSPLAGMEVRLECTSHTTKKGGEFTRHKWEPLAAAVTS